MSAIPDPDKVALETGLDFTPRFNADGLIPVIATDTASGTVVMFAWMNAAALEATIKTGVATYWSRSRAALWIKGETSGNRQLVEELRTDCDQDAIWIRVHVEGHGASCHQGFHSCFYRAVDPEQLASNETADTTRLTYVEENRVFDPDEVYRND